MEFGDVGDSVAIRAGHWRSAGEISASVVGALVVEKSLEDVPADVDDRLVSVLVFSVVDGGYSHALEDRRRSHVAREVLAEAGFLLAGAGVEASRRGVRGGSVRSSCGLGGDEASFLWGRGGGGGAGDGVVGGELALPAAGGRYPSAFYVGGAVETAAFTAGSASTMGTVLLGLVAAILAGGRAAGDGEDAGGVRVRVLWGWWLEEMDTALWF